MRQKLWDMETSYGSGRGGGGAGGKREDDRDSDVEEEGEQNGGGEGESRGKEGLSWGYRVGWISFVARGGYFLMWLVTVFAW